MVGWESFLSCESCDDPEIIYYVLYRSDPPRLPARACYQCGLQAIRAGHFIESRVVEEVYAKRRCGE